MLNYLLVNGHFLGQPVGQEPSTTHSLDTVSSGLLQNLRRSFIATQVSSYLD